MAPWARLERCLRTGLQPRRSSWKSSCGGIAGPFRLGRMIAGPPLPDLARSGAIAAGDADVTNGDEMAGDGVVKVPNETGTLVVGIHVAGESAADPNAESAADLSVGNARRATEDAAGVGLMGPVSGMTSSPGVMAIAESGRTNANHVRRRSNPVTATCLWMNTVTPTGIADFRVSTPLVANLPESHAGRA